MNPPRGSSRRFPIQESEQVLIRGMPQLGEPLFPCNSNHVTIFLILQMPRARKFPTVDERIPKTKAISHQSSPSARRFRQFCS